MSMFSVGVSNAYLIGQYFAVILHLSQFGRGSMPSFSMDGYSLIRLLIFGQKLFLVMCTTFGLYFCVWLVTSPFIVFVITLFVRQMRVSSSLRFMDSALKATVAPALVVL